MHTSEEPPLLNERGNMCGSPPVPPESSYTSCWCEENVYLLCQKFLADPSISKEWTPWVVFISNLTKTVALWNQKAARDKDSVVVWDYHVILILEHNVKDTPNLSGDRKSWVYDFDTWLQMPYSFDDYWSGTFPPDDLLPQDLQSLFRLVPGELYIQHFASDRSHMLVPANRGRDDLGSTPPVYKSPPPPYGVLCGPLAPSKNNLMKSFVTTTPSEDTYGEVFDRVGMELIFSAKYA